MKLQRLLLICILCISVPAVAQEDKKLDLKDLGFSQETLKPDEGKTALMNTRATKLKAHQILGIATWVLMAATVLSAPDHHRISDTHKYLGIATGIAYFTTAYLSLSAPDRMANTEKGTNVKVHEALAWVHFPLMILTPISGIIADNQIRNGQSVHGLGSAMGALGQLSFLTLTGAAASMIFEF